MSLTGNLRTMALPDILQWISMGRKSGTLLLERRSIEKRILFRTGTIFSSWSNDPCESLGQFLIRRRLVSEEQLFKALLEQEKEGRLFGSILVAEGVLSEDALRQVLRLKAEETVYDLFLWTDGAFEFKEGELPADITIHIEMEVTAVLLEGSRRVDEWLRIREVFPTPRTTFATVGVASALQDPAERQAFELAAAGKTLAEMSLELRRSEFDAACILFELHGRRVVRVRDAGEPTRPLDTVEAIKDRLALAHQKLQERRFELATKAYEEVLALDRLNQHAKKGLIAVAEARERERVTKKIPLNKVPVLTIDLMSLTKQSFDPQEGFVISRVNGEWDVQSILKVCPMREDDALMIFSRLLERGVIELR
jgi:hypothetical protein